MYERTQVAEQRGGPTAMAAKHRSSSRRCGTYPVSGALTCPCLNVVSLYVHGTHLANSSVTELGVVCRYFFRGLDMSADEMVGLMSRRGI
jgi:hypothetical protein